MDSSWLAKLRRSGWLGDAQSSTQSYEDSLANGPKYQETTVENVLGKALKNVRKQNQTQQSVADYKDQE